MSGVVEDPQRALARMEAARAEAGLGRPLTPKARQRFLETLGRSFGKLTVIGFAEFKLRPDGTGGAAMWRCRCTCGRTKSIHDNNLHAGEGATRGCGSCSGRDLGPPLEGLVPRLLAMGLECEGSLGVYRSETQHASGRRYRQYAARVNIGMAKVGRPLLEQILREVGVGKVHAKGLGGERQSPSIQIQWNNDDACYLAGKVECHLVTKYPQARLVREYPSSGRGRRVRPEVVALRDRLVDETRHWNAKGPDAPVADNAGLRAGEWVASIETLEQSERDRLLARAIDFEGAIMIRGGRNRASVRGRSHEPVISVHQAVQRRAIVEIVCALAGAGKISSVVPPRREGEAATLSWAVHGRDAIDVAGRLSSHLVLKRRQAEAVAQFPYRGRTPVRLSDEDFAIREGLFQLVKRLNDRYRDLPGMREALEDGLGTPGEEAASLQGGSRSAP